MQTQNSSLTAAQSERAVQTISGRKPADPTSSQKPGKGSRQLQSAKSGGVQQVASLGNGQLASHSNVDQAVQSGPNQAGQASSDQASDPNQAVLAEHLTADLAKQQSFNRDLVSDCDALKGQLAEARREIGEKERHLQGLQVCNKHE